VRYFIYAGQLLHWVSTILSRIRRWLLHNKIHQDRPCLYFLTIQFYYKESRIVFVFFWFLLHPLSLARPVHLVCIHILVANRMQNRIRASISLKSIRVPELHTLFLPFATERTSISLLRRTPLRGEEVTPTELVSGSDGKARGLPCSYSRPVFKTSLFSGRTATVASTRLPTWSFQQDALTVTCGSLANVRSHSQ